jgi:hypothetical protein
LVADGPSKAKPNCQTPVERFPALLLLALTTLPAPAHRDSGRQNGKGPGRMQAADVRWPLHLLFFVPAVTGVRHGDKPLKSKVKHGPCWYLSVVFSCLTAHDPV